MNRDPNMPTQRHRVERALRFAGSRGLTQIDVDPPTLDGLPPIRRLASRINELRAAGWIIDSSGRRLGMARYVLVSEPTPAPIESTRVERPLDLLALDVPTAAEPANAITDWDGE